MSNNLMQFFTDNHIPIFTNINNINNNKDKDKNSLNLNLNLNLNFKNFNLVDNSFNPKNKEVYSKFAHSNEFEFSFAENFQKKNLIRQLNLNVIGNIYDKNNNNNNTQNEYNDLSYLRNKNSPNLNQNPEISKVKKSIELDFKIKYKTEKCKFWEINQTCKFRDNVK